MPLNVQRAYRRRLLRVGTKRNGKDILVAGGKAAAAVFASVLGGGGGGTSTSTVRTATLGSKVIPRLTGNAVGLGLNGVARSTLALKTVSPPLDCSERGARGERPRKRRLR